MCEAEMSRIGSGQWLQITERTENSRLDRARNYGRSGNGWCAPPFFRRDWYAPREAEIASLRFIHQVQGAT
jgi:hypothetical protein